MCYATAMAVRYVKGSLFTQHVAGEASAYLAPNRGAGARALYAAGFFDAGDLLATTMVANRAPVDTCIYPLLFLYRHAVELAVKQIAADISALLGIAAPAPGQHNPQVYWQWLRPHLDGFDLVGRGDRDAVTLDEVDDIVTDLVAVDPDGQAGRYDVTSRGMPTLDGFGSINIVAFHTAMTKMHAAMNFWLHETQDRRAEVEQRRRARGKGC